MYPTIRVPSHPGRLLMGVYDGDGLRRGHGAEPPLRASRGRRCRGTCSRGSVESAIPEAIYAGPLYYHFGHFLLESLARAWYARRHPDLPLVWAGVAHTGRAPSCARWQTEVLDILGITNPTRSSPTRPGSSGCTCPTSATATTTGSIPSTPRSSAGYEGPAQVPGERLWLSRSKLANDARDLNSEATERRLADAGWTVIHPETLSVPTS